IAEDGANSLTEYPIYFVKGQIWVNNHAHVLKINKDVSPLFLALALKQINYSKYTVGSSRNKLNLKDLENIAIFIPDNNEQQRIGQFYSNYLNYLRINKKRIQYMKQFKQFLLQNMFI
ncbi:restriction endonuclease subunit S, partial [Bifidobacterium animalis subsp. lactis]